MMEAPIVIDPGSYRWRVGFANNNRPKTIFITETKEVDHSAIIEDGFVTAFDDRKKAVQYYEHYIQHGLRMLNCDVQDSDICLALPLQMKQNYRRQLAEIVMEKLGAASVFFICQPLLAGYSSGLPTCIVVDSGYTYTSIFGMQDLYPVSAGQLLLPMGGRDVDRLLAHLGPAKMATMSSNDIIYLKEHYCSILGHPPRHLSSSMQAKADRTSCHLPDGRSISLGRELYDAPELLFHPARVGLTDVFPIDQAIIHSAFSAQDKRAYALLHNIIYAGGNTKFHGFRERLRRGVTSRTEPKVNRLVKAHSNMELAVWVGGSIFASLTSYRKMCITRADYKEHGSRIVSSRWL